MTTRLAALALLAGTTIAGTAHAGTIDFIDFDNITQSIEATIPDFYKGVHWVNFGVVAATDIIAPEGVFNAVVSPDYVAFPTTDPSTSFAAFGGTSFTLQDAYFGAWSRDGLEITAYGYNRAGDQIDELTFSADTLGPQLITFDWTGLYSVAFTATGGTENPNDGNFDSTNYTIDNLRLADVVPEPAAFALFGLGFGALALRRRA